LAKNSAGTASFGGMGKRFGGLNGYENWRNSKKDRPQGRADGQQRGEKLTLHEKGKRKVFSEGQYITWWRIKISAHMFARKRLYTRQGNMLGRWAGGTAETLGGTRVWRVKKSGKGSGGRDLAIEKN